MNCPNISTTPAKNSYKRNEELSPAAFLLFSGKTRQAAEFVQISNL
jgi:hypothetical protein